MREGTPGQILALLREGRQQAQELAAILGIDTSAVRRHLETLRAEGLVDTQDVIEGPGRPKKLYGLTLAGRETSPRDYALLLDLVLGRLAKEGGHDELERLLNVIAKDLGRQVEGKTMEERLDAMLALYNKLGFEASIEERGGEVELVQRNCIFLKTARGDPPLLCECLDEGIMRAAIPGSKVELQTSLAVGGAHCRHRLKLPRSRA